MKKMTARNSVVAAALAAGLLCALAPSAQAVQATGGTVKKYKQNGTNYVVHIFKAQGSLSVTVGGDIDVLAVAGGGGGGGNAGNAYGAGGGGAGGLIYSQGLRVAVGNHPVAVGAGGVAGASASDGANGEPSLFGTLKAVGGGGGARGTTGPGLAGGSGGGGSAGQAGGACTSGQGKAGGAGSISGAARGGGGGGGAGGAGHDGSGLAGGAGGEGLLNGITGSDVLYAVGGAGGHVLKGARANGANGAANTGNGGGALGNGALKGGVGGSGIVVVRYREAAAGNQPPEADAQAVATDEDTAKAITLTGFDPEGAKLAYAVVAGPAHGTLAGAAPNLTYTPAPSFNGADSFTFKVSDGALDSAPAPVSISVALRVRLVPTPIITPAGGTIGQPQSVTITPAVFSLLPGAPGWRTGVKHPDYEIESVAALSQDGQAIAALRARTAARIRWQFPGAGMSPDGGLFPFYIWSLADLSGTYLPSLFAGVTESTGWDGNNYDFYYAETGNRVFLLLQQSWDGSGGDISLWSCASGLTQGATPSQNLANYARIPMGAFAAQAIRFEFAAGKVRLVVGAVPLVSAATDAAGWVTYTGTNGSGRVTAPLGATRFWIMLAGGDAVGSRELVISDKPKTTTRFTFDGSPVTEASLAVTGALTLTHDATLRARVYSAADGQSAEAVATFTSTMPLLPLESNVSPVDLTIAHATLDGTPAVVSVDGPSGSKAGIPIGNSQYLVRYPLSADAPTPLTLRRSGLADLSAAVAWRAFDLAAYGMPGAMTIRVGDSLRLAAGLDQTNAEAVITITDESGSAFGDTRHSTPGTLFPVLFDRAGTFTATATLDGVSAGALAITVVQVDLQGPIACQIGFRREKEVLVYGPTNAVVFTANAGALLQVSVKGPTDRGVRLYAKPLTNGMPVIQARLGSAGGPVVALQEVDEFTLRSQATTFIAVVETFPDGAKLLETNLELAPKVEGLMVRLHIVAKGVTFEDSTLDLAVNTSAFTYDAASGKWLYPYRMIASADFDAGSCHSIAVYQGSDQVGQ